MGYPLTQNGVIVGIRQTLPFNRSPGASASAALKERSNTLFRNATDVFISLRHLEAGSKSHPPQPPPAPQSLFTGTFTIPLPHSSLIPSPYTTRRGVVVLPHAPSLSSSADPHQPVISRDSPRRDADLLLASRSTLLSNSATLPGLLFTSLLHQCSRAMGLSSHTPLAVVRTIADAVSSKSRGRISAPSLINALMKFSPLGGTLTYAAAHETAAVYVSNLWPLLEAVAALPGGRTLSVGELDFRLVAAAVLPLISCATRTVRLASLWAVWSDVVHTSGTQLALTQRALGRALAALVAGADAAAGGTLGNVDAAATGRALAALAFRDISPGGAPAYMSVKQFEAWCQLRGIDLLGGQETG